jgi:Family of unknown function (DUF6174)
MRAVFWLAAMWLAAALPASASADGALDAARAKWRAAKLGSYEYGYRKFCECHRDSPPETVVSVRDGKVVNVRHRPVGSTTEVPAAEKNFEYYWTVEGLFELIAAAEMRHVEVRARYDATVGYPTEIYIDYDKNLIGDELDLKLTGVTPLPR